MVDLSPHRMVTGWVAITLMLLAAMAGCAQSGSRPQAEHSTPASSATPVEPPESKPPARPSVAQRCSEPRLSAAREVGLRASDGTKIFGAELGSGPRGLVLLHTSMSTGLCGWSPAMLWLADAGFHVFAIDSRCSGYSQCKTGEGLDLDLLAATDWLRSRGAETVIAVGGSQGSSVALATAARPDHDLDAVVALSGGWPHEFYTGPDASRDPVALARRVDVPVLYVSALGDVAVPQQEYRALFRATASQGTDYIALKGSGHAMSLLGYFERSRFFRTDFLDFLGAHSVR